MYDADEFANPATFKFRSAAAFRTVWPPEPLPDTVRAPGQISRTFLLQVDNDDGDYVQCSMAIVAGNQEGVDLANLFRTTPLADHAVQPGWKKPLSDFDIDLSAGGVHVGEGTLIVINLVDDDLYFNPDPKKAISGDASSKSVLYDPKVVPAGAPRPRLATFKVSGGAGTGYFGFNIGVIRHSRRTGRPDRFTETYYDPQIKNDG